MSVKTYTFDLVFALPNKSDDPESFVDALYDAGCDDSLIGLGRQGQIALDFMRQAPSKDKAVRSAIESVHKAIPGCKFIEEV